MSDWDNDYSRAGPGTKRRLRDERRTRPRERSGERKRLKPKPVRERLTPEYRDVSGIELKSQILALTLAGLDPRSIAKELEDENIRASLVLIGNVHRHFKETIKLLREMGLINEKSLKRYIARD